MSELRPAKNVLDSPEAVVQTVIEALENRRWSGVFRHIDPSDVTRWRRTTTSMLRHMEAQPGAGELFVEWGSANAAELEALADEELFVRWLRASSLEARARVVFRDVQAPPPPQVQRVVLGTVREGEDLAHVVYREVVNGGSALRIASLRRAEDGWRLGIDHDLLAQAAYHFGPIPLAMAVHGDERRSM